VEPSTERSHHRAPLHRGDKSNTNRIILAAVAAVAVIIIGGVVAWSLKSTSGGSSSSTASVIDSGKYQAVFLTNSQVYFGKLQTLNNDYFKLTDIFYLQSNQTDSSTDSKNPQQTSTDQNADVQLIKLGSELHGPDDEMVVSKDQVLFFENLKADGKVSKSISQYQSQNK
jgi:hypothetical protein